MLSKILLFTQGQDTSWDISYALPTTDDLYVSGRGSNAGKEGVGYNLLYGSQNTYDIDATYDFRFSNDGTKVIAAQGRILRSYALSPPYSFANGDVTQVGTDLDVSSVESVRVTGLYVRDDGFKMYIVGEDQDEVNEYVLSTAWDVSTATLNHTLDYTTITDPTSVLDIGKIMFKPDGKKMWLSRDNGTYHYEFDLTDAWDLSTATLNERITETLIEPAWDFSSDGRYVISTYGTGQRVVKLTSPYDINADVALLDGVSNFELGGQANTESIQVVQNGASIAICEPSTARVVLGSFSKRLFQNPSSYTYLYQDIKWNPDGTKLYFRYGASIYSYEFTTPYDFYSLDTESTNLATANLETGNLGGSTLGDSWDIQYDGMKFYTLNVTDGSSSDVNHVYGFNLSSSYDLSSATRDGSSFLDVDAYHEGSKGIAVRRDGTRLYVIGPNLGKTKNIITQYDIDPDGAVEDAVYAGTLDITGDGPSDGTTNLADNRLSKMTWKHDGSRFYVVSRHFYRPASTTLNTQPHVLEYRLTSPWDVTSATLYQYQPVPTANNDLRGIDFHPEGLRMWLNTHFEITEYSLEDT